MLICGLIFAVVLVIGIAIGRGTGRQKPVGDLRVDCSDRDGPYLFLEPDTDVGTIKAKKTVTFRVKIEDLLPQD